MKKSLLMMGVCLLVVSMGGCGLPLSIMSEERTMNPLETPTQVSPNPVANTVFFIDTDEIRPLPEEPHIVRSRFVKIHLDLLMDETGQVRDVKEITLNLYPDVVFTGVIEEIVPNGDGYSWSGYLKGVETSYFTMVFTSGVFMGHFASPLGVYEAVIVEGDLYRVIMIDQTKFPGGEG